MKRPLILAGLTSMLLFVPAANAEETADLRVLFVRNSLTYYNDVPEMVRQLSRSDDKSARFEVEMLAAGGASVAQHLTGGYLMQYMSDGYFDFVVFQDIGGWPICPPEFPGCADSVASIAQVVELIRSKGAEPIWCSTYQRIPAIQTALSDKARQIAGSLDIRLADVGAAWSYYETIAGEGAPFLDDGHPNQVGSFIAAATILQAMSSHTAPLKLDVQELCFREWQGTGLSKASLSSEQKLPNLRCVSITPEIQQRVFEAANKGFNSDAGEVGAGSSRCEVVSVGLIA